MKNLFPLGIAFLLFSISANARIIGSLDNVNSETGVANGWAADLDEQGKVIEVQFYVDDAKGANASKMVGSTKASIQRDDLVKAGLKNVNKAFTFTLPDKVKDGKSHELYAFGVYSDKKSEKFLLEPPKKFTIGKSKK